ncbi:uncharacterized protein LOC111885848 [Lactuca sativa]|uniref:uncharacterized protein LOC111885848 n=1 Tax=Lactuca sativa TaxID=4236 RepID=UPI000CD85E90|nr:uncharacterized protein LOC111885848 [Lactuca sativa]
MALKDGIYQIGLIDMRELLIVSIIELEKSLICLPNPKSQYKVLLSINLQKLKKNTTLVCLLVQKDIIHACAKEATKSIIKELGEDYFAILADESADITHNEQMSLCLRYVDKKGDIVERFLSVVHVVDTITLALKKEIYSLLAEYSLSPSKIRGQGYDGASNMKGESNGLKNLILKETTSAYYVHCFAHQFQLTLVAVSKKSIDCGWLFEIHTKLLNAIGVSCKRKEMLREAQAQKVSQEFDADQLESGKGLNQELSLGRPGDTSSRSHCKLIVNVISLYHVIREVLDKIGDASSSSDDRLKADVVAYSLESFDFIFMIHLMKTIFDVENDLNNALQRKVQDIVNAMSLVTLTRRRLQEVGDNGWEPLLSSVITFCEKNCIEAPNMEDVYIPTVFVAIIDLQLQELKNRFDEVSMDLLVYMASLSPIDDFKSFDKEKIITLAKLYPSEFSSVELVRLGDQLDKYIYNMKKDDIFQGLKDLK